MTSEILGTLENPHVIEDGEVITQPGIYAMSMAWYHADCCDSPSISSSGIRKIWSASPAHYWWDSPYNPNRPEPDERPHFSIGRAAHHLLYLGRKGFDDEFVIRPSEWKDWRTAAAQEWRKEQIKAGKTIITEGELEAITGMARSLAAHPLVKQGILDGAVERSLIFRDPVTGVWVKARPDNVPNASATFADFKSTHSVSDDALSRTLAEYGYHVQAAIVGMASRALLGVEMESFALVWAEKAAPHCVDVTELTPADLERGALQARRGLDLFAECIRTNEWPGPAGKRKDARYLALPSWAAKRIDTELELIAAETPANDTEPHNEAA
jgi:hypothetical protein